MVGVRVQSFQEWMEDSEAMTSQISDQVRGLPTVERQIGRTAWLKKKDGAAIPYPELKKLEEVEMDAIDKNKKPSKAAGEGGTFHEKPLVGYKVVDFTNVLAGPNCGRMLCELGATVYKVKIARLYLKLCCEMMNCRLSHKTHNMPLWLW